MGVPRTARALAPRAGQPSQGTPGLDLRRPERSMTEGQRPY
jgi:hypothetical protein